MDDLRSEVGRLRERQAAALDVDATLSKRATQTRTLVFVLCGLLNLGILAWAYRRITEALRERDVALHEARARSLELQRQKELLSVTLSSIGDCVLVTDNEGRITFMNPVAEEVTGWKLEGGDRAPDDGSFSDPNEHTRAPVESPVDKVIREGVIVGLANHTLLIRKDGSEIPIDDSGAPIRDGQGGIRGSCSSFAISPSKSGPSRNCSRPKTRPRPLTRRKTSFSPCSPMSCALHLRLSWPR